MSSNRDGQVVGDARPRSAAAPLPDGGLVVEADQRCRPLPQVEQVRKQRRVALRGRFRRPHQNRIRQHADLGERGGVSGQAGVAGEPLCGPAMHRSAGARARPGGW